jgi:hypothetical protein
MPGQSFLSLAPGLSALAFSAPALAQSDSEQEPAQRLGPAPTLPPPALPPARPAPPVSPDPAPLASQATSRDAGRPRQNDAAQVSRDGTFLPLSVSARIGDQYVSAQVIGGYDSTQGEGGLVHSVLEGAIFNRLAVRVGLDYRQEAGEPQISAGLRAGILRQEQHKVDLGLVALYKNKGFYESDGELELMLTLARRWGRTGLFANLVYGQGFEQRERDAEVHLALLFAAHQRVNVGLDTRGKFDLGEEAAADADDLHRRFDFIGGPLVSVSVGPVAFLANAGVHVALFELTSAGAAAQSTAVGGIAMAGLGSCY